MLRDKYPAMVAAAYKDLFKAKRKDRNRDLYLYHLRAIRTLGDYGTQASLAQLNEVKRLCGSEFIVENLNLAMSEWKSRIEIAEKKIAARDGKAPVVAVAESSAPSSISDDSTDAVNNTTGVDVDAAPATDLAVPNSPEVEQALEHFHLQMPEPSTNYGYVTNVSTEPVGGGLKTVMGRPCVPSIRHCTTSFETKD